MANRRFGGGPPQKIGGFSQHGFQGNKVNPWQGGAGPNANLGSGLLSQLSAPQAQLALAITSLLQPQQQMNNPPSLLSLPTNPAFNNQDDFGPPNRFNNRGGGRDFRRPEPFKFNQNRSGNAGWRDNSTRPTGSFNRPMIPSNRGPRPFGNKDRKSPPKGGKSPKSFNKPPNKNVAKVSDTSKTDESLDESRDEDGNETQEKKRDWKQEKNGDEGENGEAVDLTEDATAEGDEKKDETKKQPREGRYYGVPSSLLHCFVCNKSMWDGESFQNHLRGKAHKQMMDSMGQSFQITVNILRENMRLVEEKRMIELERVCRNNRHYHRLQDTQSHCNMCDLKYLGKITTHRKAEGHQRLKRFLHPKCEYCALEFPSRMEWVEHRFTADHLRKVNEVFQTKVGGTEGAPVEEDHVNAEMDIDPLLDESLQTEEQHCVLELDDDLKDLQNRMPAYIPTRGVGTKTVQPASGFYCEICVRFLTTEEASQNHLRSEKHYNAFLDAAKVRYKQTLEEERNAKKRKVEEETESSKKAKLDGNAAEGAEGENQEEEEEGEKGNEMYDPEEACDESAIDNAPLDEEFAEVDRLIKTVEEDQEAKQPAQEEEAKPAVETNSPRVARRAAATPVGNVRNGAGPKSRTRKGGK